MVRKPAVITALITAAIIGTPIDLMIEVVALSEDFISCMSLTMPPLPFSPHRARLILFTFLSKNSILVDICASEPGFFSLSFRLDIDFSASDYVGGGLPPASSFNANPMIPQIQKNIAKVTLYSPGTKSGSIAPAVPRARKNADKPRTMACIPLLRPSNCFTEQTLEAKRNKSFDYLINAFTTRYTWST